MIAADDAILAVHKPSGMLSIPDRFDATKENLAALLSDIFGKVFVVHRLDKDTSGVMLFARTAKDHALLNTQFSKRSTRKKYIALVQGVPPETEGVIDVPIGEDKFTQGKMRVDLHRGKSAHTSYRVLESWRHCAFVELFPSTGRMHQLRVHCAHIGCPILCDPIYGNGTGFYLSSFKPGYKKKFDEEEKPLLARLALHAYTITITHPRTAELVEFVSRIPEDMALTLKMLRKYASVTARRTT